MRRKGLEGVGRGFIVYVRLLYFIGISSAPHCYHPSFLHNHDKPFQSIDLYTIQPRVKHLHHITFEAGNALTHIALNSPKEKAIELFHAANQKYQEALKIKPDNYRALYNYAFSMSKLAEYHDGKIAKKYWDEASEKYHQCLILQPNDWRALFKWGTSLMKRATTETGRRALSTYSAASAKLMKAVKYAPTQFSVVYNAANANLMYARALIEARCYEGQNEKGITKIQIHLSRAIEFFHSCCKLKSHDISAIQNLAVAYATQGRAYSLQVMMDSDIANASFAKSFEQYELAYSIAPSSHILVGWGNVLFRQAHLKLWTDSQNFKYCLLEAAQKYSNVLKAVQAQVTTVSLSDAAARDALYMLGSVVLYWSRLSQKKEDNVHLEYSFVENARLFFQIIQKVDNLATVDNRLPPLIKELIQSKISAIRSLALIVAKKLDIEESSSEDQISRLSLWLGEIKLKQRRKGSLSPSPRGRTSEIESKAVSAWISPPKESQPLSPADPSSPPPETTKKRFSFGRRISGPKEQHLPLPLSSSGSRSPRRSREKELSQPISDREGSSSPRRSRDSRRSHDMMAQFVKDHLKDQDKTEKQSKENRHSGGRSASKKKKPKPAQENDHTVQSINKQEPKRKRSASDPSVLKLKAKESTSPRALSKSSVSVSRPRQALKAVPQLEILRFDLSSAPTLLYSSDGAIVDEHSFAIKNIIGTCRNGLVFKAIRNSIRYALKFDLKQSLQILPSGMTIYQHPNIVMLRYLVHTETKIIKIFEYIDGCTFLSYIKENFDSHNPNEQQFRYYFASLVSACSYLQQEQLSFSDFKPESILIRSDGTLCLLCYDDGDSGSAHRAYLAPELLSPTLSRHSACDMSDHNTLWWSVGVFVVECLTGMIPEHPPSAPYLPRFSDELQNLISHMLSPNPSHRLASGPQIKAHPFFFGIDFDSISDSTPPWKPRSSTQALAMSNPNFSMNTVLAPPTTDSVAGFTVIL